MKPEIQDLLDKHTFETIYEDFSYNKDQQAWNKRTKSEKAAKDTIVRIAHVAPRNRELHVFLLFFTLFPNIMYMLGNTGSLIAHQTAKKFYGSTAEIC